MYCFKGRFLLLSGLLLAAGVWGCSPASLAVKGAKEGYKVLEGAEAHVLPLKEPSPSEVESYSMLRLGEVTTDISPVITAGMLKEIRAAMQEEFDDERWYELFAGGGKTLSVHVVCRFFKEKSFFGKMARLDMLVSLQDREAQVEVARLLIEGFSESPLEHDLDHLAAGNAKELCKYLQGFKKTPTDKPPESQAAG